MSKITIKSTDKANAVIEELENNDISVFDMIDKHQDEVKIDNNAHKPQK
ncbi:hypothetical protein [Limosilactobacillus reuteri]|nr:hypothetical protein [Limosilactobacillus reuteri]MCC4485762.1 hypothetical protein [Limosilactobacillus reuteri]